MFPRQGRLDRVAGVVTPRRRRSRGAVDADGELGDLPTNAEHRPGGTWRGAAALDRGRDGVEPVGRPWSTEVRQPAGRGETSEVEQVEPERSGTQLHGGREAGVEVDVGEISDVDVIAVEHRADGRLERRSTVDLRPPRWRLRLVAARRAPSVHAAIVSDAQAVGEGRRRHDHRTRQVDVGKRVHQLRIGLVDEAVVRVDIGELGRRALLGEPGQLRMRRGDPGERCHHLAKPLALLGRSATGKIRQTALDEREQHRRRLDAGSPLGVRVRHPGRTAFTGPEGRRSRQVLVASQAGAMDRRVRHPAADRHRLQ